MAVKGEVIFKDAEGNELEGPNQINHALFWNYFSESNYLQIYKPVRLPGAGLYDPFEIYKRD